MTQYKQEMLSKQILQSGEGELVSSQEVFHANPFQLQENVKAQMTRATCGPKCLERLEKHSPGGSWQKMFTGLLVGVEDWYSSRCVLTWKTKVTPFNRMLFRLQVSMPHTEETGSGLLPTITSETGRKSDFKQGGKSIWTGLKEKGLLPTPQTQGLKVCENRKSVFMDLKMLPTPTTSGQEGYETRAKRQGHKQAMTYLESNLEYRMKEGMLPTPTANDSKNATLPKSQSQRNSIPGYLLKNTPPGQTFQLNSRFVLEMMGFPVSWCDNAFWNILTDYWEKKKSTKSFQKRVQNGAKK